MKSTMLRDLDVSGFGKREREAHARWAARGGKGQFWQDDNGIFHPPWHRPQRRSLLRDPVREEPFR